MVHKLGETKGETEKMLMPQTSFLSVFADIGISSSPIFRTSSEVWPMGIFMKNMNNFMRICQVRIMNELLHN